MPKQPKLSPLERVCKTLDSLGVIYMRANVQAQDKVTNQSVPTKVVICGAVFSEKGDYMFACPVANPISRNHSPTDEKAG